jgi:hypothetical protein
VGKEYGMVEECLIGGMVMDEQEREKIKVTDVAKIVK